MIFTKRVRSALLDTISKVMATKLERFDRSPGTGLHAELDRIVRQKEHRHETARMQSWVDEEQRARVTHVDQSFGQLRREMDELLEHLDIVRVEEDAKSYLHTVNSGL